MLDFKERIQNFISDYFKKGNRENHNVSHTTSSMLSFLFSVFPKDCISEYDLDEILQDLGFSPEMDIIKKEFVVEEKGEKYNKVIHELFPCWFFNCAILPPDTKDLILSKDNSK